VCEGPRSGGRARLGGHAPGGCPQSAPHTGARERQKGTATVVHAPRPVSPPKKGFYSGRGARVLFECLANQTSTSTASRRRTSAIDWPAIAGRAPQTAAAWCWATESGPPYGLWTASGGAQVDPVPPLCGNFVVAWRRGMCMRCMQPWHRVPECALGRWLQTAVFGPRTQRGCDGTVVFSLYASDWADSQTAAIGG